MGCDLAQRARPRAGRRPGRRPRGGCRTGRRRSAWCARVSMTSSSSPRRRGPAGTCSHRDSRGSRAAARPRPAQRSDGGLVHAAGRRPGDVVLRPHAGRGEPGAGRRRPAQAEAGDVVQRDGDGALQGRGRRQPGAERHQTVDDARRSPARRCPAARKAQGTPDRVARPARPRCPARPRPAGPPSATAPDRVGVRDLDARDQTVVVARRQRDEGPVRRARTAGRARRCSRRARR